MEPLKYENRHGKTYVLHARQRSDGRVAYVLSPTIGAGALAQLPAGYEISENVHGHVGVRKTKPSVIRADEVAAVRHVLDEDSYTRVACEVHVRGKVLEVYERDRPYEVMGKTFERTTFQIAMRFTLVDPDSRTFDAERACWRSWANGWLQIGTTDRLEALAASFLPHIGKESFYDLAF